MKKIYYSILFFLILTIANNAISQNTCATPYQIFSPNSYTYNLTTGIANTDTTNNYGCLPNPNNPTWFYFKVCNSGTIVLGLTSDSIGTSSNDIGFIAWGPLSSPLDSGLTSAQVVDCGLTSLPGAPSYINFPSTCTYGQYYKIMITNYTNQPGFFTLNYVSGGGTYDSLCSPCSAPIPVQQICHVTTDPVLNHNIIIWNKDSTYHYSYYIQKETTTAGVYSTIATVLNSDTSAYEDLVSNPMIQSFKYRIETTDSCGNLADGNYHETIHLLTSISSSTGYPQLLWNPYEGFGYGTYYIFRGASPSTLVLYDSISASFNSYTDVAAVSGLNYYSVSVMPPAPCHPSRSLMNNIYSFSNVSPVEFTGINEYELTNLSIWPNPANDVLNFSLGNVSADVTIDIIDVTGRVVISKLFKNTSQERINLTDLSNGSYVVRFISKNGSTHKNIIVAK